MPGIRVPMGPEYYDQMLAASPRFRACYKDSPCYPLWAQAVGYLRRMDAPRILEIGCGTGQFAHFLADEGFRDYHGFDFSPEAVRIALQTCSQSFAVADAMDPAAYEADYTVAVCFEVLEHLVDDFAVLANLRGGAPVIFSLPTFDDPAHLRFFRSPREIILRYRDQVTFRQVLPIIGWYICLGTITAT